MTTLYGGEGVLLPLLAAQLVCGRIGSGRHCEPAIMKGLS